LALRELLPSTGMTPETIAPVLLVAMPQLEDRNFQRTVVLLIEHSNEGAMGLVLNRGGDLPVSDLCDQLQLEWTGDPETCTRWGGPVEQNTGWMLFSSPPPDEGTTMYGPDVSEDDYQGAKRVMDGLYFGFSLETLRDLNVELPEHFRLFLGYAGWGPGQLEQEMARGDWIVAPAQPECVFGAEDEDLWTRVLQSIGVDPSHLISTAGVH